MDGSKELTDSGSCNAPSTDIRLDHSHSHSYDRKSVDVEEKSASDDISVDDLDYKDEALRLVGMERKMQFSDEQYSRVRRKLVSRTWISHALRSDLSFCFPCL